MATDYKLGDRIEAGPLMGGLVDTHTILTAIDIKDGTEGSTIMFNATYYGVHLGKVRCVELNKDKSQKWSWVN